MNQHIAAVGGTNKIKVAAVQTAFDRLSGAEHALARGTAAGSACHEQPIDLPEGRFGALFRATESLRLDEEAFYGVGIENTIVFAGVDADNVKVWIDIAVVAVVTRDNPKPTYSSSVGIPCPAADVEASLAAGQDKTAGSFIGLREGCAPADWHKKFTGHRLDRSKLLADAVYTALALRLEGL